MIYCIDTNVVVDIFRGDTTLLNKIENITKQKNNFFITILTLAELYKGAYLSARQEKNILLIKEFIKNIEILNFSKEASEIYGKKFSELQNLGKQTEEIDLLIGSIILANDANLITKNKNHFENISGLKITEL